MGLVFSIMNLSPFLGSGITSNLFQAKGNVWVNSERLKMCKSCFIRTLNASMYNVALICKQPDDFE